MKLVNVISVGEIQYRVQQDILGSESCRVFWDQNPEGYSGIRILKGILGSESCRVFWDPVVSCKITQDPTQDPQ